MLPVRMKVRGLDGKDIRDPWPPKPLSTVTLTTQKLFPPEESWIVASQDEWSAATGTRRGNGDH